MKRKSFIIRPNFFLSILLSISLAITGSLPSQANQKGAAWNEDSRAYSEGWPWPPLPNWWNRSGSWYEQQNITNLRLGFWLACKPEWSMNDCIDSINIYDAQGKSLGSLTYVQNPDFNPFESRQKWFQVKEVGDGPLIDNSAIWVDGANYSGSYEGHWLLPDGLTTPSGNRKLVVNVHRMLGSIQAGIQALTLNNVADSLPTGLTFEVILKSKELVNRARWIHSNGKDPQVFFRANDLVVLRGVTAKMPWPASDANVCKAGNDVRAIRDAVYMGLNIFMTTPNPQLESAPSEVIIGTNGWWCFSGLYWDSASRSLVANVGAAHFYSDGSVVDGWLEIKIKASRVRQWWGVSPEEASGYAKVDVVYENGQTKVATVSARYIKENDWLDIRAYGFTFSNPSVRISIDKPTPSPTPTPTEILQPTPVPQPAASSAPQIAPSPLATVKEVKKSSITCTKGKLVRKVTAVNPKCPKGYTLKRGK